MVIIPSSSFSIAEFLLWVDDNLNAANEIGTKTSIPSNNKVVIFFVSKCLNIKLNTFVEIKEILDLFVFFKLIKMKIIF